MPQCLEGGVPKSMVGVCVGSGGDVVVERLLGGVWGELVWKGSCCISWRAPSSRRRAECKSVYSYVCMYLMYVWGKELVGVHVCVG